jgi:prepilin signal peptidase PulO-like enzyme (type II secretory pathway)
MEQLIIYSTLILTGLCLGSFAGASVWRLRAHQLLHDKTSGEHVDSGEYKHLVKLTKTSLLNDRSQCLNCSYKLKWYDMIPLVSWIYLAGKCRKCRKSIGYLEPMIEIGVAVFFVLSYAFWPLNSFNNSLGIAQFILWLIAGVGLAILFVYDMKWSMLPDTVNVAVIIVGAISSILVIIGSNNKLDATLSIFVSALILSGFYWALHAVSHGKWIGFGDVKLGLGLALLLADWRLAFIALFAANLVGCLIVLPAMITGKLKRNSQVPFGPLFIIGFVIAKLAGGYLINICFYNLF